MESTESKKRPALEPSGGPQKMPRTSPNPNPKNRVEIAYHSSIEDKENNPLEACKSKMAMDSGSLSYDAELKVAANKSGFDLLERLSAMEEKMAEMEEKMETFEGHRLNHLALRERAISTWVRDALKKDTARRNQEIKRLNTEIIHGADIHTDAIVLKKYRESSTEWQAFSMLYGLTLYEINKLDKKKCESSLLALNRAAALLFKDNRPKLPSAEEKQREALVDLLRLEKYREAEEMSGTFLVEE
ncbi:uncharacterized protein N7458_008412 [Penicillium daleae]|uniref:Uncharacterized protein n=1 Tax=Penicillium daleae TaxID=63821 RepID=A0AAD6C300_9EURO|nr:uncharacterized protein N7458_008412 [Penicillium daleae]KAJ5444540.1 hypothetical protein N7458_008412 [Penicillium daleae]